MVFLVNINPIPFYPMLSSSVCCPARARVRVRVRAIVLLLVAPVLSLQTSCRSTPTASTLGTAVSFHNPPSGLSDRTKWAIQPAGASATLGWHPGEPLVMNGSGNPMWPAAISSYASGNTALARPAGRF